MNNCGAPKYTFDPAGRMTNILGKFQGQTFRHQQRYDGFGRKVYEIFGVDDDRDDANEQIYSV